MVVVEVDTCSYLVGVVDRNTVVLEGVAVYFFPPGVVL